MRYLTKIFLGGNGKIGASFEFVTEVYAEDFRSQPTGDGVAMNTRSNIVCFDANAFWTAVCREYATHKWDEMYHNRSWNASNTEGAGQLTPIFQYRFPATGCYSLESGYCTAAIVMLIINDGTPNADTSKYSFRMLGMDSTDANAETIQMWYTDPGDDDPGTSTHLDWNNGTACPAAGLSLDKWAGEIVQIPLGDEDATAGTSIGEEIVSQVNAAFFPSSEGRGSL